MNQGERVETMSAKERVLAVHKEAFQSHSGRVWTSERGFMIADDIRGVHATKTEYYLGRDWEDAASKLPAEGTDKQSLTGVGGAAIPHRVGIAMDRITSRIRAIRDANSFDESDKRFIENELLDVWENHSIIPSPSPATPAEPRVWTQEEREECDHVGYIEEWENGDKYCSGCGTVVGRTKVSVPPSAPPESAEEAWNRGFDEGVGAAIRKCGEREMLHPRTKLEMFALECPKYVDPRASYRSEQG